jgi:hypothetical protein
MKKLIVKKYTPNKCLECGDVGCKKLDTDSSWNARFICLKCGVYHNVCFTDKMGGNSHDATAFVYERQDDGWKDS